MKRQERQHLKQNEFVETVTSVMSWFQANRDKAILGVIAAVVVVLGAWGVFYWKNHTNDQAAEMLGAAMTIYDSPVVPPSSVPGAVQQAGSYPSEQARSEAALKAFQSVADQYSTAQAGLAARYHAAEALLQLGRAADAHQAYQKVIDNAGSSIYGTMAKLGLANTMLAEGQSDQAIKMFDDLAAQRDGVLPVDGVLMQLGSAYEKLGKKAEARTAYKRVVDEFPDSPYAQSARTQMTVLG